MEQIFSSLQVSNELLLNEMAILLAKQQLSEYIMENEYYEKKYNQQFESFDREFRNTNASYDLENDWMSWKFAIESQSYWQELFSNINFSFP